MVDFHQSIIPDFCNDAGHKKSLQILLDATLHKPKLLQLSIALRWGRPLYPLSLLVAVPHAVCDGAAGSLV